MPMPRMVRSACLMLALAGAVPAVAAGLAVPPPLCFDVLPGEALSVTLLRSGSRSSPEKEAKARAAASAARDAWRSALDTRPDPLPHAYLGLSLAGEARRERNGDRRKTLLEAAEFHLAAALDLPPWGGDGRVEIAAAPDKERRADGRSGRDDLRLDRLPPDKRGVVIDRSWEWLISARLALLGFAPDGADRETRFGEVRRLFADGIEDRLDREDGRRVVPVMNLPWDAPGAPRQSDLVWQRMLGEAAWLGETDYLFRKLAGAMPAEPWPPGWDEINVRTGLQWLSCALYPEWRNLRGGPVSDGPAGAGPDGTGPEAGRALCLERARACFLRVSPTIFAGQWAVFGALTADLVLGADAGKDGGPFLREAARLAALMPPYAALDELWPVFLHDLALSGDRGGRSVLDGQPWYHACRAAGLIRAGAAIRRRASPSSVDRETRTAESDAWTRALVPEAGAECPGGPGDGGVWLMYLDWLRDTGGGERSGLDNGPLPRRERRAAERAACLAEGDAEGWWAWWRANASAGRDNAAPDAWLEANAGLCPAFAAFAGAGESLREYHATYARPREERLAALAQVHERYEQAAALPHPGLAAMLIKGERGLALQEGEDRDVSPGDRRRALDLCLDAHRSFTALRDAHGGREGREGTVRRDPLLGELLSVSVEERIAGMASSSPWRQGAEKAMKALLRAPGEPLSDELLRLAREAYGFDAPDAPPLERDVRLADKLVEMNRHAREGTRKGLLLDKAADLYAAALDAGDRSVCLRLGDALRERVTLMTGPEAGDEGARRRLESALAWYEAVLDEDPASGRAHEGKALALLEQCARGFRNGPDAGAGRIDGVAAALAEARGHYVLATGLPPEGARTDDAWSKTLRRVADGTDGPGGDRLRAEADALALRLMGGIL